MNKQIPQLIVVAGCNGSGKSTFSGSLMSGSIIPFDSDKCFLKIYNSKPDSELRETIARNLAFERLEDSIKNAILNTYDFCYETNFHSEPMYWPDLFKQHGYSLKLFYFCLDSIEEARRRVQIRYQNKGHFVPDHEVEERYQLGYHFLNKYYKDFDSIELFDTSTYDSPPGSILTMSKGKVKILSNYPKYLRNKLPDITKIVDSSY